MTAPVIVPLVPVLSSVLSAYDRKGQTGRPRSELQVLGARRDGVLIQPAADALAALHRAVEAEGGDLRVSDCHRSHAVQAAARAKYDAWVAAGKPRPGSAGFDGARMKAAFVALPGRSNHNGGRAVDLDLARLALPGVDPGRQLDRLWALAMPLGWSPVIRAPDERASEAWHFDFYGDLAGVFRRRGYEQGALAAALLVGHGPTLPDMRAAVAQALLQRAGFDCGAIDGQAGERTRRAWSAAMGSALDLSEPGLRALYGLPAAM